MVISESISPLRLIFGHSYLYSIPNKWYKFEVNRPTPIFSPCPVFSDNHSCLLVSSPGKKEAEIPAALSEGADSRHILSIAQDIIHATTHGRVKTPKHVGLAMSVRLITGSKQLITMLNRLGHCLSYDETERIDTSLALEVTAKSEDTGVCIPSNIVPGGFVQVAADNNDINEETLDGKQTTHATTVVLYQRKQYGPDPKPAVYSKQEGKRRSLDSVYLTHEML